MSLVGCSTHQPEKARQSSMNQSPEPNDEPVIQTVAEPIHQLLKRQAALEADGASHVSAPGAAEQEASSQAHAPSAETVRFRPTGRQPLALLTILDDGYRDRGEKIRIRSSRVTIGREKGDVTIAFDADISSQHAELRYQEANGTSRWYLVDLNSTNGTFLRAYRAQLSRETELIFGSRRYRFQTPIDRQQLDETKALKTQAYQAPPRTMVQALTPQLTEMGIEEASDSAAFAIAVNNTRLGRGASCEISIPDDPLLSAQHATFIHDKRGRWTITDNRSLNGIWIRIKRMPLDQPAEFQIGQQRFYFQPHAKSRR